ncbi:MAG: acyl carrier protein [Gemmatimonadota bacterium]|nr:acyl carrier protein [Gemmatimonadota bacterium]
MTVSYDDVEKFIREEVASFSGQKIENVAADTVLLGAGRVVDSADLVMLLLAAEDFSREKLGASFDWTSDSAMSEARSVLRNVGSLAKHLVALQTG